MKTAAQKTSGSRFLSPVMRWISGAVSLLFVLGKAGATEYPLPAPGEDIIGQIQTIKAHKEDTLIDIARTYDLGYEEIKLANPKVDPWLPGEGTDVILPTRYILPEAPREGVVINVVEMRLYYYPKVKPGQRGYVLTYPLGIGRMDWKTPLGVTKVVRKAKDPIWYPPDTIQKEHAENGDILPKMVPAGPDNPLGGYAIYMGIKGYLIHGTNQPYGIGMQVTHGCVRLYPEDIETLFQNLPIGTDVRLVNQPYKVGRHDGKLYVEVHPPLEGENAFDPKQLLEAVTQVTGNSGKEQVNWPLAESLAQNPDGMPESLTESGNTVAVPVPAPVSDQTPNSAAQNGGAVHAAPSMTVTPVEAGGGQPSRIAPDQPAPAPAEAASMQPAGTPSGGDTPGLQEIDTGSPAETLPQSSGIPVTATPVAPVLQEEPPEKEPDIESQGAGAVEVISPSPAPASVSPQVEKPQADANSEELKSASAPETPNPPRERVWQLGPSH